MPNHLPARENTLGGLNYKNVAASDPEAEARLQQILQTLYGFYHTEIGMDLSRVERFLAKMGDLHLRLPPVVHVAGTNGKGSVIATLRALLEETGHTVHVATSPHLVHPTERIRLAGQLITTTELADLLEECLALNGDEPITFFEIFMAATFLAFSRVPADFCLLETGLGGRLDATNVIPQPACTVITAISHDHSEFLGDTLAEIAGEKAGIMKPGVPCVISMQPKAALEAGVMDVFERRAAQLSPAVKLHRPGAEWSIAPEKDRMRFSTADGSILLQKPNLLGNHQLFNSGAALATYRIIRPDAPFQADILSTALQKIDWPGRLQTLKNHSLTEFIPENWEIVIDGGHNDSAGEMLARQAQDWAETDRRPLHIVAAMVTRKNPAEFLGPLARHAASLTVTAIPGESSSYAPDALYEKVLPLGFPHVSKAASVAEALKSLPRDSAAPARVLITGSLYLLGTILEQRWQ